MTDESVPRVRRGRRNARYTAISNDLIDHPTLSPEARVAIFYLLSKHDDWELQPADIQRLLGTGSKASKGKKKGVGRNKAYAVLKELKDSGYIIAVVSQLVV